MKNKLKIGDKVYHKDIYNYREQMEVVGLTETEVLLKGDFSGGTHSVEQKEWMPIKGTSRIYNYGYKRECRQHAVDIQALAVPITDRKQDTMTETMFDLLDMVFVLTTDVELNPEFK